MTTRLAVLVRFSCAASLETTRAGFWTPDPDGGIEGSLTRLRTPAKAGSDIELALRLGATVERVAGPAVSARGSSRRSTSWSISAQRTRRGTRAERRALRRQHSGLSDHQIASLRPELLAGEASDTVTARAPGHPPTVYKTVDLRGGLAQTPTTTAATSSSAAETEVAQTEKELVLILRFGAQSRSAGYRFDTAAYAAAEAGFETVMVSCNPGWCPTTTPRTGCTSSR